MNLKFTRLKVKNNDIYVVGQIFETGINNLGKQNLLVHIISEVQVHRP